MTIRRNPPAKVTRTRYRTLVERAPLRGGNLPLPGLEAIREESRPTPAVAEAPFALTPPLPAPPRRAHTTLLPQVAAATGLPRRPAAGTPPCTRLPLLDRLHATDALGVMLPPGTGREALQDWLHAQEPDHGKAPWFARMTDAVTAGDWDRAYRIAVSARFWSVIRAFMRARTPEERDAVLALVKRHPTAPPHHEVG